MGWVRARARWDHLALDDRVVPLSTLLTLYLPYITPISPLDHLALDDSVVPLSTLLARAGHSGASAAHGGLGRARVRVRVRVRLRVRLRVRVRVRVRARVRVRIRVRVRVRARVGVRVRVRVGGAQGRHDRCQLLGQRGPPLG